MTAQRELTFDGPDLAREDEKRLTGQLGDVLRVLRVGQWRTLAELSAATKHPEASCSARIRDLRKPRFGGYKIDRRRRKPAAGLWEYRMVLP